MFAAAGKSEVVNFDEVGASGRGFEGEGSVAVERRVVVGSCEFFSVRRKKNEDGVEA